MAEIKTLLRASSVSNKDLTFAVGQTFSSDQQRSVKLKKNKIRPGENAVQNGIWSREWINHQQARFF